MKIMRLFIVVMLVVVSTFAQGPSDADIQTAMERGRKTPAKKLWDEIKKQNGYRMNRAGFGDPIEKKLLILSDLDRIDWALLQSRSFQHDPEDPGRKERYQAEALVWKHVPVTALAGIACYSHTVNNEIQELTAARGLTVKTGVQPNWYFQ